MATLPLLIFPTYETAARAKKGGGETTVHLPSAARQGERIGPQILRLERAFAEQTGRLQTGLEGADPEKVIVLETVGAISEFMNAVRRIEGMEWLAELDEDQQADADFYRLGHDAETIGGRLYLVMSNRAAMDEMIRFWRAYQANPEQRLVRGSTSGEGSLSVFEISGSGGHKIGCEKPDLQKPGEKTFPPEEQS